MIKCVMLDLDGTLLNTLSTITYYVNLILQKYAIPPIKEEDCKRFVGDGAKMLVRRTLEFCGICDADFEARFLEEYMAEYNKAPLYLTAPYEGIPELVSALASSGIKLAVVSNKQHAAVISVVESFFCGCFDMAEGGKEGIPLKPAPDVPLAVLASIGCSPAECAYVGDSEVDMKTGKNFGAAYTVGVSWGFRDKKVLADSGADIIIDKPAELLRLI